MAGTIIGEGITIEGELSSDEDVVVRGHVRGKLIAREGVVVEAGATVEADVSGGTMTISGSITGNVNSTDRVDLQAGAKLVGNVKAARITIADGAQFKGSVDMDV